MLSTHGQLPWKPVICYLGGREMMHRLFSASLQLRKKRKDYAFWRQFNEKASSIAGCAGLQLTHVPASTYVAGGTPDLDLPSGILRVGGQSSAAKAAQLQMQNLVSYCLPIEP